MVALAIQLATGDCARRAAAAVAAVAVLAVAGYAVPQLVQGDSLNRLTSDRTERVEDTARVIAHHLLVGVRTAASRRPAGRLCAARGPPPTCLPHHAAHRQPSSTSWVSRCTCGLLVGGARLLGAVTRLARPLGLALGAAFLALFVHAGGFPQRLRGPDHVGRARRGRGFLSWARRGAEVAA